jgi:hypothetical protein
MNFPLRFSLCFALAVAVLFGQATLTVRPGVSTAVHQIKPQAIPTTMTDVITRDVYVCYIDFYAAGQTITVQDRQASPIPWFNGALTGTWLYSASTPDGCRWMPGGVSWQASGSGASGTMVLRY